MKFVRTVASSQPPSKVNYYLSSLGEVWDKTNVKFTVEQFLFQKLRITKEDVFRAKFNDGYRYFRVTKEPFELKIYKNHYEDIKDKYGIILELSDVNVTPMEILIFVFTEVHVKDDALKYNINDAISDEL